MSVTVRLVAPEDVPELTEVLRRNREFLAPWDPERDDRYFTEDGQRQVVSEVLDKHAGGSALPLVIVAGGSVVGRINVNDVVRGAFQSGHLGYWVDRAVNGRGIATAAVAAAVRLGFGELGLHRLQAGTLPHNTGSQRVLTRNGFTEIGLAPRYLRIAGRWQDHVLYQRVDDADGQGGPGPG